MMDAGPARKSPRGSALGLAALGLAALGLAACRGPGRAEGASAARGCQQRPQVGGEGVVVECAGDGVAFELPTRDWHEEPSKAPGAIVMMSSGPCSISVLHVEASESRYSLEEHLDARYQSASGALTSRGLEVTPPALVRAEGGVVVLGYDVHVTVEGTQARMFNAWMAHRAADGHWVDAHASCIAPADDPGWEPSPGGVAAGEPAGPRSGGIVAAVVSLVLSVRVEGPG